MSEEGARYRVVFTGETRGGEEPGAVAQRLAEVLKIDPEKARRILSGRPRPVGKLFERGKAEKLRQRIEQTGAGCFVERADAAPDPSLDPGEGLEPPRHKAPPPRSQPLGPDALRSAPTAWSLEPIGGQGPARPGAARPRQAGAAAEDAGSRLSLEEDPSKAADSPSDPAAQPEGAGAPGGMDLALEERAEEPASEGSPPGPTRYQVVCPKCGHRQSGGEECEACGIVFHKYQALMDEGEQGGPGAASGDEEAAPVIPERDLERYVGPNSRVYLDKFDNFRGLHGERFALTWHWPAFFVPFFWALYRKLWLWAVAVFISQAVLPLISNVVWALTANYIYYRQARRATEQIRQTYRPRDAERQMTEQGGTSPGAVWIAIAIYIVVIYLYLQAIASLLSGAFSEMTDMAAQEQRTFTSMSPEQRRDPKAVATLAELGILSVGVKIWMMGEAQGRTPREVGWTEIRNGLDLSEEDATDAWGNRVRYEGYSKGFALRSAGPDGSFGTDDDIVREADL